MSHFDSVAADCSLIQNPGMQAKALSAQDEWAELAAASLATAKVLLRSEAEKAQKAADGLHQMADRLEAVLDQRPTNRRK